MANAEYYDKAPVRAFQKCMDQISPIILKGDFDQAFEVLDDYRIGPNTTNPRDRNFAFWLIEEQCFDGRASTEEERRKFLEFFKLFVDRGVELDHQERYGLTLLNWATYKYCVEACLFLLDRGASPNIADSYRITPLNYATVRMYLLGRGQKAAAEMGRIVIPALFKAGADPYAPYPTFEEAHASRFYAWNLNREKDGVRFANLFEEVAHYYKTSTSTDQFAGNLKLFLDLCSERDGRRPSEERDARSESD